MDVYVAMGELGQIPLFGAPLGNSTHGYCTYIMFYPFSKYYIALWYLLLNYTLLAVYHLYHPGLGASRLHGVYLEVPVFS